MITAIVTVFREASGNVYGRDGMRPLPICRRDSRRTNLREKTNYKSKKASDLAANKKASLLFFWPDLQRQVRIEGTIEKLPEHESDEYFSQRPFESQVGAWVSAQSQVIEGREALEKSFEQQLKKYEGTKVPRPAHWGGYVLLPFQFEFWQGRSSRLHDRLRYRPGAKKNWIIERLMP